MGRGTELYVLATEPIIAYAAYLVAAVPLTTVVISHNWAKWWIVPLFVALYYLIVRGIKAMPMPRPQTPGIFSDQFRSLNSTRQQTIVWTVQRTLIPFGLLIGAGLAYATLIALSSALAVTGESTLAYTLVILFASGLTGMWVMDRLVHQYASALPAHWTRPLEPPNKNTK